jgi:hypothetical protein
MEQPYIIVHTVYHRDEHIQAYTHTVLYSKFPLISDKLGIRLQPVTAWGA